MCLTGLVLLFSFLILYEGVGVFIGSVGLVIPDQARRCLQWLESTSAGMYLFSVDSNS